MVVDTSAARSLKGVITPDPVYSLTLTARYSIQYIAFL